MQEEYIFIRYFLREERQFQKQIHKKFRRLEESEDERKIPGK
jgi:hypothetical protein